jgi:biotin carboxylase
MPTVAVILPASTYRAADFIKAADGLGLDLVVASDQPLPFAMGDRYIEVDCSDAQEAAMAIVELGDRVAIDGIVAADDAGVVVASLAGQRLGVLANDPGAAAATRDKAVQRALLRTAEVPQPDFAVIAPEEGDPVLSTLGYPVVIKPLDRSAGQGVLRVDSPEDLREAIERVRAIVGHRAGLIAESFLVGNEVAVEGLVTDAELTTLAVLDKPDSSSGPVFEETILVTPSELDQEAQSECRRVAAAAIRGLGIVHGPVHVELKVSEGRASVLEVAARSIGGLCSQSLNFGLMGTSLETLILRNALGWDKPELRREPTASGVLMIPVPGSGTFVEITNLEMIREIAHITGIEITARAGTHLDPPPVGDNYLGFVFARAQTPDLVTDALRKARDEVRVIIE